jgi:hypothetical protein
MLYDCSAFKPYIYMFCFSRLVHVPHIYKHSIGPTSKSIEYHHFRQFPKFMKLPSQFLSDMSGSGPGHVWVLGFLSI